ncbi:WD40-repeat-containing domain protein [Lipomyces japonicus]|uniref:WD40-repeat-containing domain protein n=1 Tax=Lipomyces japonicus TaxID=56871 RepID=UPI0034CFD653
MNDSVNAEYVSSTEDVDDNDEDDNYDEAEDEDEDEGSDSDSDSEINCDDDDDDDGGGGDEGEMIEIISTFHDTNRHESFCSVCWTQDPRTGKPLLAVGGKSGVIKVLDCQTGKIVRTLVGHGDEILDLQVNPRVPHMLASCSGDHTIRVWNLDRVADDHDDDNDDRRQPFCVAICGGAGGHREQVLTVAFHDSGRFLLSGGMDNQIHMWALPADLSAKRPGLTVRNNNDSVYKPVILHWSHFATSVVHSNYVDSVGFLGDLILSRAAAENKIVLWRINGFRGADQADELTQANAPTDHDNCDTLSRFKGSSSTGTTSNTTATYTRLAQFNIPHTMPWYMRFGMTDDADGSCLLAMGSDTGRVYLKVPTWFEVSGRSGMADPFGLIRPQQVASLPRSRQRRLIRHVAFSPDGSEFMVAVGDGGLIAVFA